MSEWCCNAVLPSRWQHYTKRLILPWIPSSSFSFSPLMSVAVTWAPSFANAYIKKDIKKKQMLFYHVYTCHYIKPATQYSPVEISYQLYMLWTSEISDTKGQLFRQSCKLHSSDWVIHITMSNSQLKIPSVSIPAPASLTAEHIPGKYTFLQSKWKKVSRHHMTYGTLRFEPNDPR